MSFSIGIVGLPNVGKSTLFNALLQKQSALVADYPFTTIKPNEGIVPVTDPKLEQIAKIVGVDQFKPATITFIDIAGLVKGAHQGEGLGNKFLAQIRETKAICCVIRFFSDPNVSHVLEKVNPKEELAILEEELILADLQILQKQKPPKANATKDQKDLWQLVQSLIPKLDKGALIIELSLTPNQQELLQPLNLITLKPFIYLANLSELQLKQGRELLRSFPKKPVMPISAKLEMEFINLSLPEREELLKSVGLAKPALESLIQAAYQALNLVSFYTIKNNDVRAWALQRGKTAPEASSLIHTDLAKKFIKAEVVSADDFIKHQGWQACVNEGIIRTEGQNYQIQPEDIVEFKIQN